MASLIPLAHTSCVVAKGTSFELSNRESTSNPPDYRLDVVRSRAYREIVGAWSGPALIACSGGVDSSALVVIAREALRSGRIGPFAVCHVDHRTRADSLDEQRLVAGLCSRLGIPFIAAQTEDAGPVPGRSLEDVWRERRYSALMQVARRLGIHMLVTAHTNDDQVETVLMRMFAGSGRWLMPESVQHRQGRYSVKIVRPLLGISRTDLGQIVDRAGFTPFEDPGNSDTAYLRSAVRTRLVPAVADVFGDVSRSLVRSAQLREMDAQLCDEIAEKTVRRIAIEREGCVCLPIERLLELHPAIASRVIRLMVLVSIGENDHRELSFERIDAVLQAASGRQGVVIELPYGLRAVVDNAHVCIVRQESGAVHE